MSKNREIKFRAWDIKRKEMKYVDNIQWSYSKWFIERIRVSDMSNLEVLKSDEVELMQFTGLLDKNGKEIWEGDIMKCVSMHDSNIGAWTGFDNDVHAIPREIKWEEQGFNVPFDHEYWEVIGNIYENPELLTQHEQAG